MGVFRTGRSRMPAGGSGATDDMLLRVNEFWKRTHNTKTGPSRASIRITVFEKHTADERQLVRGVTPQAHIKQNSELHSKCSTNKCSTRSKCSKHTAHEHITTERAPRQGDTHTAVQLTRGTANHQQRATTTTPPNARTGKMRGAPKSHGGGLRAFSKRWVSSQSQAPTTGWSAAAPALWDALMW